MKHRSMPPGQQYPYGFQEDSPGGPQYLGQRYHYGLQETARVCLSQVQLWRCALQRGRAPRRARRAFLPASAPAGSALTPPHRPSAMPAPPAALQYLPGAPWMLPSTCWSSAARSSRSGAWSALAWQTPRCCRQWRCGPGG